MKSLYDYRIVKITSHLRNGKKRVGYKIQMGFRFMSWFWLDVPYKTYTTLKEAQQVLGRLRTSREEEVLK